MWHAGLPDRAGRSRRRAPNLNSSPRPPMCALLRICRDERQFPAGNGARKKGGGIATGPATGAHESISCVVQRFLHAPFDRDRRRAARRRRGPHGRGSLLSSDGFDIIPAWQARPPRRLRRLSAAVPLVVAVAAAAALWVGRDDDARALRERPASAIASETAPAPAHALVVNAAAAGRAGVEEVRAVSGRARDRSPSRRRGGGLTC